MKEQDWEKIKDIFAEVLEKPKDNRSDYLRQACGDNKILLDEIDSLLRAHDETEPLIENKDFAAVSVLGANEANYAGRRFGNYEILKEIGRGGMGAVFLAERADGEFDQRVALKIVRQTFADAEIERQFRRERQILASLNHPNVAKLLDGGVSEVGEPFLVMEYIEGETIFDYIDKGSLEIKARLKLFLKVCDAVSYAHRNLIIHRDIKPSNILVTNEGEPKLLDFGLAKIFDENLFNISQTDTGFRAFTPGYASPEQMRGRRTTTASDVYSLGVVFYELLTGERPFHFENKSYEEILNSIDTQEPPPPSSVVRYRSSLDRNATVQNKEQQTRNDERKIIGQSAVRNPQLKGDLDNIALMALRREPEQRYQSVEQFARDIERHIQGLPITARRQTFSYRAAKFIQRNRVTAAALVFVILSLSTGLTIALWQANIARRERDRAEKRFADVRGLSNSLLNDIAPKIERLEGSTEARQLLVNQSLKYLDSLAVESADDLTLQMELAAAYEKVGVLQGESRKPSLGDFRGAIASMEKAQAIRRRLLDINPNDAENRRLLAENLRLLGVRRMYQNNVEGGISDGQEAVRIYEKLVAENPGSLPLQTGLLETQVEDAISYAEINRFAESVPMLQRTAAKIEELSEKNPDNAEITRILAKCLAFLGFSLSWENRQPEAEKAMTRAVEITESLAARFPNDANFRQDLWRIYQIAAGIYDQVDNQRMFELCEKARKVMEETITLDRANAQARHNLALTLSRLGSAATNLGKSDEALKYLEQAAAIFSELQAKDQLNRGLDHDASAVQTRIGDAKYKRGDPAGSLAAYENSRAMFEKQIELDSANTRTLRNLAVAYQNIGSVHREYIEITTGQARQNHLTAARKNYMQSLDNLLKLESQNALSVFDQKSLEIVRTAVEEIEKMR